MYIEGSLGRSAKLKDKRVLVVEDEAVLSIVIEDELLDAGATVLGPAGCLADALRPVDAATADGGIDAAVLAIKLQGEAVGPVADRLAALGVPFLFATAYGTGRDTGGHRAAPTLPKPLDPERLIVAVEALASAKA
jgi:DNA-binding response OmpR family regulator